MFVETAAASEACKSKAFKKGDEYLYVFFLGTHTSARGRGLCSHVLEEYKKRATERQLPIYMEAATEYAYRLYLRLGFVLIDTLKMGVGRCDAAGNPAVGGPGVTTWAMVWRPEVK